ncbi:MAG: signal recognition particle protein [Bacteriovoracales bacterium]|nr:signal recognition particle protein [Bacteriovoracales bacterium]
MFDALSEKFDRAFQHLRGRGKITESNVESAVMEVQTALLEADVNFKVAKSFVAQVREKALGQKVLRGVNPREQFIKIVQDELTRMMGEGDGEFQLEDRPNPLPILMVGLNGAGKTTFTAKLALWSKEKKKRVLVVPADTFRPAAKDQLVGLCKKIEVDWFDSDLSLSPRRIGEKAMAWAKKEQKDVVLIDTAGRFHVDKELMEEIASVKDSLNPFRPEVFLVADAMTGQEAVNVAKSFHGEVGLTGVVLSKMDGDARGGAALSMRSITGVPIRFFSQGERAEDLELFHADRLASRLLDKGDVVGLVEKAQKVIDEEEAQRMMENLEKNRFTMGDLMKQMEGLSRLGSMGDLLKMVPGMGGMIRQMGDLGPAEDEMKKMKVVMNSMTLAERDDYRIIKNSRITRIAKGSGTGESQVRHFLAKFKQMETMMSGMAKMMKRGGGMPFLGGGGMGPPDMSLLGKKARKAGKGKGKGKGKFGGGHFW